MNSSLTSDIDLQTLREDLLGLTPMCCGMAFELTRVPVPDTYRREQARAR